jgi:hypothetical protein
MTGLLVYRPVVSVAPYVVLYLYFTILRTWCEAHIVWHYPVENDILAGDLMHQILKPLTRSDDAPIVRADRNPLVLVRAVENIGEVNCAVVFHMWYLYHGFMCRQ